MESLNLYKKGYTFSEICNLLNTSSENLVEDFKNFDELYYEEHIKNLKERILELLKTKKIGEISVELDLSTKIIKKIIKE